MPLPRFERLAATTQRDIIAIAREHFARDGRIGASFNQIIADAGISKTTAYHYFDGKEDLFASVAADCTRAVVEILGPWMDCDDRDRLWQQLEAGSSRMTEHLRANPDHRVVLMQADPTSGEDAIGWLVSVIDNARRLGMVSPMAGPDLLVEATAGVLATLDQWVLSHPEVDPTTAAEALRQLLGRLWDADGNDSRGRAS
jgi:AcrR family transcriptional regulator